MRAGLISLVVPVYKSGRWLGELTPRIEVWSLSVTKQSSRCLIGGNGINQGPQLPQDAL